MYTLEGRVPFGGSDTRGTVRKSLTKAHSGRYATKVPHSGYSYLAKVLLAGHSVRLASLALLRAHTYLTCFIPRFYLNNTLLRESIPQPATSVATVHVLFQFLPYILSLTHSFVYIYIYVYVCVSIQRFVFVQADKQTDERSKDDSFTGESCFGALLFPGSRVSMQRLWQHCPESTRSYCPSQKRTWQRPG